MAVLNLSIISLILVLLAFSARPLPAVARVIIWGQVVYWSISYVIRPIVLLIFKPNPLARDGISDPRLVYGGYEHGVEEISEVVLYGLAVYLVIIFIISTYFSRRRQIDRSAPLLRSQATTQLFILLLIIGWFFRAASSLGLQNSLVHTFLLLGVVGSGGLIALRAQNPLLRDKVTLALALSSEAVWTVLSASKTPLIASLIFLLIRFWDAGWTRGRIASAVAAGAIVVAGFASFQEYKLGMSSTTSPPAFSEEFYPSWTFALLPIVQRFDLFSAVTDARLAGPGAWFSFEVFLGHFFGAFVPDVVSGESITAGNLWNTEIRASSLSGAQLSEVSLAEGFIAEGYAIGGYWGVSLGALWIAIIVMLVCKMIASPYIFARSLALILLGFPVLFERGILGGVETMSKGIQVSIVVYMLWILVLSSSRSRSASRNSQRTSREVSRS